MSIGNQMCGSCRMTSAGEHEWGCPEQIIPLVPDRPKVTATVAGGIQYTPPPAPVGEGDPMPMVGALPADTAPVGEAETAMREVESWVDTLISDINPMYPVTIKSQVMSAVHRAVSAALSAAYERGKRDAGK